MDHVVSSMLKNKERMMYVVRMRGIKRFKVNSESVFTPLMGLYTNHIVLRTHIRWGKNLKASRIHLEGYKPFAVGSKVGFSSFRIFEGLCVSAVCIDRPHERVFLWKVEA